MRLKARFQEWMISLLEKRYSGIREVVGLLDKIRERVENQEIVGLQDFPEEKGEKEPKADENGAEKGPTDENGVKADGEKDGTLGTKGKDGFKPSKDGFDFDDKKYGDGESEQSSRGKDKPRPPKDREDGDRESGSFSGGKYKPRPDKDGEGFNFNDKKDGENGDRESGPSSGEKDKPRPPKDGEGFDFND